MRVGNQYHAISVAVAVKMLSQQYHVFNINFKHSLITLDSRT